MLHTNSQVSVDASITRSPREVLVLPVGDVLVCLGVSVLLGETEVDHVDLGPSLPSPHEEVVGLDVSVNEVLGVDVLHSPQLRVKRQ